jgi:outer membrane protein assembly factor BamB
MSAAVTTAGRVFYIADLAPLATIRFKGSWTLFGRDAFSGVELWRRDVPVWNDHLRHFRSGPVNLPRRLAAIGDRVYVTLGLAAPVSELDAATGETLQVYKGTEYTEEMLVQDGVLYLVVGTSETDRRGGGLFERGEPAPSDFRYILAVDATSGKILWKHQMQGEEYLLPLSLTVKDDNVYYQSTNGIARLDAKTGALKWQTPRPTVARRMAFSAPTIVATDEVLLAADREPPKGKAEEIAKKAVAWGVHGWNEGGFARTMQCTLRAYDVENGQELWSTPCGERYNSPVDVFVVGDTAWIGTGITGYDVKTGDEVRKLNAKGAPVGMPHHRCYRNKATTTHILTGRSGIEVVSLDDGWLGNNSWIRGTCQYGIMPANGLLYAPPDACACYNKTKVFGFFAAGPTRDGSDLLAEGEELFEKGPAYGKVTATKPADDD